ncbi:MAG: hypothetical protein IPG23_06785 [Burkholderiales bacterium]|nr:hypothetical protein [Burkholderiales bacterium]
MPDAGVRGLEVGRRARAPTSPRQISWAVRFAQVKEEPAQRAGDTEQNAQPN